MRTESGGRANLLLLIEDKSEENEQSRCILRGRGMCICPMSPSKAERNEVKTAERRDGNVLVLSSNTKKNVKITTKTVLTETRDGEKKRKKNAWCDGRYRTRNFTSANDTFQRRA